MYLTKVHAQYPFHKLPCFACGSNGFNAIGGSFERPKKQVCHMCHGYGYLGKMEKIEFDK